MGVLNKDELLAGGLMAANASAKVFPHRRLPNIVTGVGDSRVDAFYLSADQLGYNSRSPIMMANALLGQRFIVGQSFGKSGDRTDQTLARMLGLLPGGDARATNAGILYLQCGVNNIAQVATSGNFTYVHAVTGEVVTAQTVAAVTARDLRQICALANAAGMIVVMENEIGANGFNSQEKVSALMTLRRLISEFGEITPGVFVHDAFGIMTNATFSATAIQLKPTLVYDVVTHPNTLGAYRWAKSLAPLLASLIPNSPRGNLLLQNIAETQAGDRRQLLLNPLFANATGGTIGANVTGTAPSGFGVSVVGGATVTAGTQVNANGYGNDVTLATNFAGNGDAVRLNQSLSGNGASQYNAALQVGDIVQAVAVVEITAPPSNLSSLYLSLVSNTAGSGGTSVSSFDLFSANSASDYGIDEACTLTLATRPFALLAPTGTFPFMTAEVRAVARAAGSLNCSVRQMGTVRRDGLYL